MRVTCPVRPPVTGDAGHHGREDDKSALHSGRASAFPGAMRSRLYNDMPHDYFLKSASQASVAELHAPDENGLHY